MSVPNWTWQENKDFETALSMFDENTTDDRWVAIAELFHNKSVDDVIEHYNQLEADIWDIEAEAVAIPDYGKKRIKKGIKWSEEEYQLFLRVLREYGKGSWTMISKNLVRTRTPSQIASHAQKYFQRQLVDDKEKKKRSINDITTDSVELMERVHGMDPHAGTSSFRGPV